MRQEGAVEVAELEVGAVGAHSGVVEVGGQRDQDRDVLELAAVPVVATATAGPLFFVRQQFEALTVENAKCKMINAKCSMKKALRHFAFFIYDFAFCIFLAERGMRSVVEDAQLVLAVLDELELRAFLKTTGGKGLHIVVPITPQFDWDYIKNFSKAVSQFIAKQIPERFVAKMGPQNRIGKIFIDYLRNQRGASTVAAYSVRARPGLPVSVPIALAELKTLKSSAQWHVGNLHERLAKLKKNPWQGYSHQQKITSPMWKKLGAKVPTK